MKNIKKFNTLFSAILVSSAFFVSCSKDNSEIPATPHSKDDKETLVAPPVKDNTEIPVAPPVKDDTETPATPRGDYESGLFVVNEGNSGHPNGNVSYLSDTPSIENDIFTKVNTERKVLGHTPQSIGFNGDLAYIVVCASDKIEVVNRYTFKSVATIDANLKNPRHIAFANGKGYVTNWGEGINTKDDYVAVIDLTTNKVLSKIPVTEGPEQIIENGGKLYVAHKGGWGFGNLLSVINSDTNTVTATLVVGDVPGSLIKDNGILYVLCNGNPSYSDSETAGKLVKVNMSDNTISSTIDFSGVTHPDFLAIDNNKLYYTIGTSVYSVATNTTVLPSVTLFKATQLEAIYGFAVKNNTIYIADALNHQDSGKIYIFSLTGTVSNEFDAGILPNGFYFNK